MKESLIHTSPRQKMNVPTMEKQYCKDVRRINLDTSHAAYHWARAKLQLIQKVKNIGYVLATTVRKLVHKFTNKSQQVRFKHKPTMTHFHNK